MLSAEIQHSAKALIVKMEGGCTSDDAECVRMLTEVTFGDSVGETTLSSFSGLGAKVLARDVYEAECLTACLESVSQGLVPTSWHLPDIAICYLANTRP